MIGAIIGFSFLYLAIVVVGGAAYHDFTKIRPRLTYTEAWATAVLWPILLPILLLKGLLNLGRGISRVLAEVPAAITRVWQS